MLDLSVSEIQLIPKQCLSNIQKSFEIAFSSMCVCVSVHIWMDSMCLKVVCVLLVCIRIVAPPQKEIDKNHHPLYSVRIFCITAVC